METILNLEPIIDLTDEQFFALCQQNPVALIERNAHGEVIIMPPTSSSTGARNAEIIIQLGSWAKRDGTGITFDSSSGFRLPNTAIRAPDASWVSKARLELLNAEDKERFYPLCPDFVLKLRSPTDELGTVQKKMQEYIDNGAQLGWLIDPDARQIHIYRPHLSSEILHEPESIIGDPLLPGFTLDLREIW